MKIHPYLNFEGKAEEAFRRYEKVLGGKLTEIHRFGSMPQEGGFGLTPEQENLVLHVGLELPDGQMIMASDMIEGMGPGRVEGNNFSISVHPDTREEADRIFDSLAEGGTITMPIADQFWGDYFGSLTDRFGVNWMVNYSEPATRPEDRRVLRPATPPAPWDRSGRRVPGLRSIPGDVAGGPGSGQHTSSTVLAPSNR